MLSQENVAYPALYRSCIALFIERGCLSNNEIGG
jgi:hypothetical protein